MLRARDERARPMRRSRRGVRAAWVDGVDWVRVGRKKVVNGLAERMCRIGRRG